MTDIGCFDAKTHLSRLLDRVSRGESFTITRHGKPVARLVPLNSQKTQADPQEVLARLRKLRREVKVRPGEIREWIEEGRRF